MIHTVGLTNANSRNAKPIRRNRGTRAVVSPICGRGCAWTANRRLRRGDAALVQKRRATQLKVAA